MIALAVNLAFAQRVGVGASQELSGELEDVLTTTLRPVRKTSALVDLDGVAKHFSPEASAIEALSEADLCIVQHDDRSEEERDAEISALLHRNRRLCEQSSACHYFLSDSGDMPPWWAKVRAVRDAMRDRPSCQFFYWIDSDATIRAKSLGDLAELFEDEKSIVISGDMPPWTSPFCAGVWGIRNDADAKEMINDWLGLFPDTAWHKDEHNHWQCRVNGLKCVWAGEQYEQGSFITHLEPKYASRIQHVSFSVLNNPDCHVDDGALVSHFAGASQGGAQHEKIMHKIDTCFSVHEELVQQRVPAVLPVHESESAATASWRSHLELRTVFGLTSAAALLAFVLAYWCYEKKGRVMKANGGKSGSKDTVE